MLHYYTQKYARDLNFDPKWVEIPIYKGVHAENRPLLNHQAEQTKTVEPIVITFIILT